MTVGNKTLLPWTPYSPYVVNYNYWGAITSTTYSAPVNTGTYHNKTWSGTDQSSLPVYEDYLFRYRIPVAKTRTWTTKKGVVKTKTYLSRETRYTVKRRKVRRRVDKNTRVTRDDHPYSCTITWSQSQPWQRSRKTFGGDPPKWFTYERSTGILSNGWAVRSNTEWSANDTIKLVGKLREKIAGSDFNAGVALGESREALTMIADNANRIFRAYSAIKRGNIFQAADALGLSQKSIRSRRVSLHPKETASNWLMLQYGWLPLLKDVEGGAQFVAARMYPPVVQVYKARVQVAQAVYKTTPNAGGGGTCITRGQLIARIEEVDSIALSGLLDPMSVAWELLPFSFVADWFIPIGNYLQARSLNSALKGTYVRTITRRSELRTDDSETNIYTTLENPGVRVDKVVSVTRTVDTSLAVPLPNFKPLMEVPSWKRAANAISLLTVTHGTMWGRSR